LKFATQPLFLYQLAYVVFAVLALQTHAFYAYHILDYIGRTDQLREMFISLARNKSTLGVTAVLWGILTYVFVIIGYWAIPEDFETPGATQNPGVPFADGVSGNCVGNWNCFIYHASWSNRMGGGIGDSLLPAEIWLSDPDLNRTSGYNSDHYLHYYFRSVFDLSWKMLIGVVMVAVVTGIVIDAFGASRDNRATVLQDEAARCFICGIDGSRFDTKRPKNKNDKRKYGFDWHKHKEHNLWNYVYFLAALKIKDPNEYTGSESYVDALVKAELTDFFPVDRALMLEA